VLLGAGNSQSRRRRTYAGGACVRLSSASASAQSRPRLSPVFAEAGAFGSGRDRTYSRVPHARRLGEEGSAAAAALPGRVMQPRRALMRPRRSPAAD
jgi:hypothetical protein